MASQSNLHPDAMVTRARALLGTGWEHAELVANVADGLGFHVHLVGGCVRDLILQRPSRDVDLVVEGDAIAVARRLGRDHGGVVQCHRGFGTAHWYPPTTPGGDHVDPDQPGIDLVTARSEVYPSPAALPVVTAGRLDADLRRRDFTINMIAMGVTSGEAGVLVDPFDGVGDLSRKHIRVNHDQSFVDDPTRAWRAVRFAARFGFSLAPDTASLLQACHDDLHRIGPERLGAELHRLLCEPDVLAALTLQRALALEDVIHRELAQDPMLLQRISAVDAVTGALSVALRAEVFWLALAMSMSPAARAERSRLTAVSPAWGSRGRIQRWLHGPDAVRSACDALERSGDRADHARALQRLDEPELWCVCALVSEPLRASVQWWITVGRSMKTVIDGAVLIAAGAKPGPALGRALRAAEDEMYKGGNATAQRTVALASLQSE